MSSLISLADLRRKMKKYLSLYTAKKNWINRTEELEYFDPNSFGMVADYLTVSVCICST